MAPADVAELRRPVGQWPAGTRGTVVDISPTGEGCLFEVSGAGADVVIGVPLADLRLIERARPAGRAAELLA